MRWLGAGTGFKSEGGQSGDGVSWCIGLLAVVKSTDQPTSRCSFRLVTIVINVVHSLIKVGSIVALHTIISQPTLALYSPDFVSTSLLILRRLLE